MVSADDQAHTLPLEIIRRIVLTTVDDLDAMQGLEAARLARCCKTFHEWCTPFIYRCITMGDSRVDSERDYADLTATMEYNPDYSQFVETLIIKGTAELEAFSRLLAVCRPSKRLVLMASPKWSTNISALVAAPPEVISLQGGLYRGIDYSSLSSLYISRPVLELPGLTLSQCQNLRQFVFTCHRPGQLSEKLFQFLKDILELPNLEITMLTSFNAIEEFSREFALLKEARFRVAFVSLDDHARLWRLMSSGKVGVKELLAGLSPMAEDYCTFDPSNPIGSQGQPALPDLTFLLASVVEDVSKLVF